MREWARMNGGSSSTESANGAGTTVRAMFPAPYVADALPAYGGDGP